jgi:hypothetical protein
VCQLAWPFIEQYQPLNRLVSKAFHFLLLRRTSCTICITTSSREACCAFTWKRTISAGALFQSLCGLYPIVALLTAYCHDLCSVDARSHISQVCSALADGPGRRSRYPTPPRGNQITHKEHMLRHSHAVVADNRMREPHQSPLHTSPFISFKRSCVSSVEIDELAARHHKTEFCPVN